jgi:hypothetical protein
LWLGSRDEVKMMRIPMPQDKQTRMNIYFLSILILAGLLFTLIFVGMNVYKHTRYSRFDLFVQGKSILKYASLSHEPSTINPTTTSNQITSYTQLGDGWGKNAPGYSLGGNDGLWFQIKPKMNGEIVINSPAAGTPLADVGFDIRNQQGEAVEAMVPGEWYKVRQYGQWFTIKFVWDS